MSTDARMTMGERTDHLVLNMTTAAAGQPATISFEGKAGTHTHRPRPWSLTMVLSVSAALLVAMYAIGFGLYTWMDPTALAVDGTFNSFALLFVLSLAIERVLQPFVPFLGPDSQRAKRWRAMVRGETNMTMQALNAVTTAGSQTVDVSEAAASLAAAEHDVKTFREQTSIVAWAAAAGLGFVLCGALGIGMVDILTTSAAPDFWLDMLITGLVIGAGTKPLNDLWSRLQNKGS